MRHWDRNHLVKITQEQIPSTSKAGQSMTPAPLVRFSRRHCTGKILCNILWTTNNYLKNLALTYQIKALRRWLRVKNISGRTGNLNVLMTGGADLPKLNDQSGRPCIRLEPSSSYNTECSRDGHNRCWLIRPTRQTLVLRHASSTSNTDSNIKTPWLGLSLH